MKLLCVLPLVQCRYGPGETVVYGPGGAGRDKMLQLNPAELAKSHVNSDTFRLFSFTG